MTVNVKAEAGSEPPEPPIPSTFTDVKKGDYFYDAVSWAVKNGVTNGKDDTHFAPYDELTRCRAVTFLWNAGGKPEPTVTAYKFTDVQEGDYFFKAVLWAVENGIVTGTTETSFDPNGVCSRAMMATLLWRARGSAFSRRRGQVH